MTGNSGETPGQTGGYPQFLSLRKLSKLGNVPSVPGFPRPNPDVFVAALGDVAKARGMAQIAKDSGLGRESLYKTLSAGAHPRFETINSVLHALGVKFAIVAEHEN